MPRYETTLRRIESKRKDIQFDAVNDAHAHVVADMEMNDTDFSDVSAKDADYEMDDFRRLPGQGHTWSAEFWRVKPCKAFGGERTWAGLEKLGELSGIDPTTNFIREAARLVPTQNEMEAVLRMQLRYGKDNVNIVDPKNDYKPYFAFVLEPELEETPEDEVDAMCVYEKHLSVAGQPAELKLMTEALDEFARKRGMDLPKTLGDWCYTANAEYQTFNDLDEDDWGFTAEDREELGLEEDE